MPLQLRKIKNNSVYYVHKSGVLSYGGTPLFFIMQMIDYELVTRLGTVRLS